MNNRTILITLLITIGLWACVTPTSGLSATQASIPGASRQIEVGAFTGQSPPTAASVNDFETSTGKPLYGVLWFQGWDATGQPPFPTAELMQVNYSSGYDKHLVSTVTWEPWVKLSDITKGVYDNYLASYAQQTRAWGLPVRLRFAHEMIQDNHYDNCTGQPNCPEWYPWQDQPGDYIAAFRHVHDIFQANGATNVAFVWCPNSYPFDYNVIKAYYPGSDYVDWLCTDGYNWTNTDGKPGYPDWAWFDDAFYNIYHSLVDHPEFLGDKPVMLGETASCEAGKYEQPGQTKAAWITNSFDRIKSTDYARIQAFYWFNINKECDWRVNSSPASLSAFQAAMTDPIYISHPLPKLVLYMPVIMN